MEEADYSSSRKTIVKKHYLGFILFIFWFRLGLLQIYIWQKKKMLDQIVEVSGGGGLLKVKNAGNWIFSNAWLF